jgi:hypothetical protein
MTYQVVIEPHALSDIQQAIDYYDIQQIGLGKKFMDALDKHIQTLRKNPFYQIKYKDYRVLPIKKYPYSIIFYINETNQTAYIMAVFNTFQNPAKQPN